MWHEARKQERKIRGMLVDYRKRAERRQDFYEKIKADPTQFMQIHSRKCKIHLDPAVAAACDSPAIMMPWQGQQDNMIDRFDGRAYLDIDKIPVAPKIAGKETEEFTPDERQCNYERYRILAQNDFLGISEEKYLHQLHLEEQFGINAQIEVVEKSKKKTGGVAIGYTYEDSNDPTPFTKTIAQVTSATSGGGAAANASAADEDSDSDLDVDVAIDISKIDTSQAHELNACGRNYGMKSNDFYSFLTKDADEADALKLAREEEQEKIMLSGRKSRRERRAQRERRFAGRPISPPSYAAKEELPYKDDDEKNESAESRSPTPENSGKITFITSFGGEDELQPHSKISINFNKQQKQSGAHGNSGAGNSHLSATITGQSVSYADKVKENLDKLKHLNNIRYTSDESPVKPLAYQRRSSYSRSRSRSKRSSRSYSRRRGRSNSRRRRSKSRSRSRRRYSKDRSNSSRSQYKKYQSSSRKRYTSPSSSSSSSSVSPVRRKRRQTSTSSSSSSSSVASKQSHSSERSSKSKSLSPVVVRERSRSKSLPVPDSISTVPMEVDFPSATELFTQSAAAASSFKTEEKPFSVSCEEPAAPIKKYYGRKREDQSTSEDDESNEETIEPMDATNSNDRAATTRFTGQIDSTSNNATISSNTISSSQTNSKFGKLATTTSTTTTTTTTSATITVNTKSSSGKSLSFNPRDRLKRKMQNLLNKQYKADKLAEIEKTERQVQQQQEREDEMRELALRLRRRQRELRHKYGTPTNSHSDDSDKSSSELKNSPKNGDFKKISKSRTRSPTPQKKRSRSRQRQTATGIRDRSHDRLSRGDHRSDRRENSRRRSPPRKSSHDRSSRFRSRSRSRDGGNRDYYNQRRQYSRDRHSRSVSRDRRRKNSRHDRHGTSSASSKRSPRKLVDY